MSENRENKQSKETVPTKNGTKYAYLYAIVGAVLTFGLCRVADFYYERKINGFISQSNKTNQKTAHEELTEQMYILETHKLNDIRNELRRANDLHERQLKQDSIRTDLARRQYLLDSARFAAQCRKR